MLDPRVVRQHNVSMGTVAEKPHDRRILPLENLYDAAFCAAIRFSSLDARQHSVAMHRVRHGIAPDEKVAFHARNWFIWHQETVSVAVRHDSSGNQIRIRASTSRACPGS